MSIQSKPAGNPSNIIRRINRGSQWWERRGVCLCRQLIGGCGSKLGIQNGNNAVRCLTRQGLLHMAPGFLGLWVRSLAKARRFQTGSHVGDISHVHASKRVLYCINKQRPPSPDRPGKGMQFVKQAGLLKMGRSLVLILTHRGTPRRNLIRLASGSLIEFGTTQPLCREHQTMGVPESHLVDGQVHVDWMHQPGSQAQQIHPAPPVPELMTPSGLQLVRRLWCFGSLLESGGFQVLPKNQLTFPKPTNLNHPLGVT